MESKIINTIWFSTAYHTTSIGIIAVQTGEKTWKAYIGTGTCANQVYDQERIKAYGSPVPQPMAEGTFPHIKTKLKLEYQY